jgi:hypothetical protein
VERSNKGDLRSVSLLGRCIPLGGASGPFEGRSRQVLSCSELPLRQPSEALRRGPWHLFGTPLQGHWFDRTRQYAARNQGEELRQDQYVFAESVVLSPIPCWAHLPDDRYRKQVKILVEDAEAEAARARQQSGAKVLGAKAILAQDPLTRPGSVACSPAPLVHAATKAARTMFYEIYAEFVGAFRAAAEALRQGYRDVPFPSGSFPPALPFVPS